MDPTKADLLQQCQRHFPRLAWHFDEGGECTAHFYGIDFYLSPEIDGSFSASILFNDKRWDWNQRGFPTAASALAAASARWQEFAALAMSVVGPVPEKPAYQPSPEIQQQSDMALAASLLEGDLRKAQGLPSDQAAQARAAADAMAWAEDNPPGPVAEAFAELREVAGGCLEGKHFDESREWVEDE